MFELNSLRSNFLVLVLLMVSLASKAQEGRIVIHEDEKLDQLVRFYSEYKQEKEEAMGYRIQILAGTSREKAYSIQGNFNYQFPDYASYLTYISPYFKVRVGDFTDKLEAFRFLQHLKSVYPGAFIVEEEVKLH